MSFGDLNGGLSMARGDHIVVPICGPMTHHGIDLGDGTVVHWSSGMPGYASFTDIITRKLAAEIRRTPFADFGDPANVHVRDYGTSFEADEVIRRALYCVGEKGYCLVGNNCEHLAAWCKIGKHQSEQVKQVNGVSASVLRLGRTGVGGVQNLIPLGRCPRPSQAGRDRRPRNPRPRCRRRTGNGAGARHLPAQWCRRSPSTRFSATTTRSPLRSVTRELRDEPRAWAVRCWALRYRSELSPRQAFRG